MRIVLKLLMVPLVVAAGWAGWWLLGATAQERAIAGWLDGRAAAGWQAERASVEVSGFPTRFERRIEDLVLTDPRHGWSLRAPWVSSTSGTFEPNRFTLAIAPAFTVAVPGEAVRVSTGSNGFALGVAPAPSMPLDDAALAVRDLALDSPDWQAGAGRLELAVAERPEEAGPAHSYNMRLEAEDVVLPDRLLRELGLEGRLSPSFESLTLDAHAALDHALDRDFVEEAELSARTVVIRRAALRWGEMALDAEGRVDADAEGFAEGRIALALTNWKQMIRLAEQSGAIGSEVASGLETALGLASLLSSRDGALKVTLKLDGGHVYIGPVAIGDAPRIAFPPRQRGEG